MRLILAVLSDRVVSDCERERIRLRVAARSRYVSLLAAALESSPQRRTCSRASERCSCAACGAPIVARERPWRLKSATCVAALM